MVVFVNTENNKMIIINEDDGSSSVISIFDFERIKKELNSIYSKNKKCFWVNSVKNENVSNIVDFVQSYISKIKNNPVNMKKYIHSAGKGKIIIPGNEKGKFLQFNGFIDFHDYNKIMLMKSDFPGIQDAINKKILEIVDEIDKNMIISKYNDDKNKKANKNSSAKDGDIIIPSNMKAEEIAARGIISEDMEGFIEIDPNESVSEEINL